MRQSVQKAKFSALCKFALCKCLSSLSDLKKIPHYANFFRFFLIFCTMQDYIRILKKAALCKSALNKDLLYFKICNIFYYYLMILYVFSSKFPGIYIFILHRRPGNEKWKRQLLVFIFLEFMADFDLFR